MHANERLNRRMVYECTRQTMARQWNIGKISENLKEHIYRVRLMIRSTTTCTSKNGDSKKYLGDNTPGSLGKHAIRNDKLKVIISIMG